MKLKQIEIDFDIHQMIELERRGFDEPPYVALRRLLKLPEKRQNGASPPDNAATESPLRRADSGKPFVQDGVYVPHGSRARMRYMRGQQVYEGEFLDGKLVVNGVKYSTLSAAASALGKTKKGHTTSLNGWLYWEAMFPGESEWRSLWEMREALKKK